MKKLIIYTTLISIVTFIVAVLFANYEFNQLTNKSNPIKIIIPKGTSVNGIVRVLNEQGLAEPDWLYKIYMKYLSFVSKKYIQAGVYLFPDNLSMQDIISSLFEGKYLYIAKVTFPEGISYKDFASILGKDALVDSISFVKLAVSDSLLKARKISGNSIDGYLLPDTYEIYMESSAKEVMDKLLNAHSKLYERISSQSKNQQKLSKHQALTLASIVEAETPEDDERMRVAGLYINRIKKKMLLQADPTVAYALNGKKRLSYDDLNVNNPYNTYKYIGLPPGPINNPGAKSIRAALNHEIHNYIYMVSKGDGSNQHNFAVNYSQHLKFVSAYRKNIQDK